MTLFLFIKNVDFWKTKNIPHGNPSNVNICNRRKRRNHLTSFPRNHNHHLEFLNHRRRHTRPKYFHCNHKHQVELLNTKNFFVHISSHHLSQKLIFFWKFNIHFIDVDVDVEIVWILSHLTLRKQFLWIFVSFTLRKSKSPCGFIDPKSTQYSDSGFSWFS